MKSRARDEEATSWQVWSRGGSIGNKGPSLVSEHSTREEAAAKAKRMNKLLSPGEKAYYGLGYGIKEKKPAKDNDVLPIPVAKARGVVRDAESEKKTQYFSATTMMNSHDAHKKCEQFLAEKRADGYVGYQSTYGQYGFSVTYWKKDTTTKANDVLHVPVARGAAKDANPQAELARLWALGTGLGKDPRALARAKELEAKLTPAQREATFNIAAKRPWRDDPAKDVLPVPLGHDESFPKGPSSPREKAGLSVQEWNALPAVRRKELIGAKDVYDPQTSIWRFEAELRELMRKGRPSQDRPAQVMWDRDKEELEAALAKARRDLAKAQAKDDSNWHGYAWAVIEVASALHVSEQKAQRMLMLQAKKTKGTWQETVDDVIAAALNKTRPKRVKDAYDYEASGDLKQDVEDALKTLADRDLGAVAISLKYDFALDFVKDVLRGKFGAGRGAITAYFKAHPLGGPGQANDAAKDAEQAKSFSGSTSREARQKAKSYADSLRAQGYEIIWVVPTGVYSYEVAYKKVYA